MDKEAIKDELISECEKLINSAKNSQSTVGVSKLKAMANHLGTIDDLTKNINIKFNDILNQQNISDEERRELMMYLKPTVVELVRKYIKV